MEMYREVVDSEKKQPCPNCASSNVAYAMETQEFQYGVEENAVQLNAQVNVGTCGDCEFEFTGESGEIARHEAVCRHLRVMTPTEVQSVRISYGLSRTKFSDLTRLGTASLARWETGQLIQNAAYDSLMFLLMFPDNLERLKHRFSPNREKAVAMARAENIQRANNPGSPRFQTFVEVSPVMERRAALFELNPSSMH